MFAGSTKNRSIPPFGVSFLYLVWVKLWAVSLVKPLSFFSVNFTGHSRGVRRWFCSVVRPVWIQGFHHLLHLPLGLVTSSRLSSAELFLVHLVLCGSGIITMQEKNWTVLVLEICGLCGFSYDLSMIFPYNNDMNDWIHHSSAAGWDIWWPWLRISSSAFICDAVFSR